MPSGTKSSFQDDVRVLVADDEKSVGTSLADLVRVCDHDVVAVVGSGLEAIQAYSKLRPDVVLMDYLMPRLNGATACRNILSRHPGARVILVTGLSTSECAIDSGALAILSKPVSLDRLRAMLDPIAKTVVKNDEVALLPKYFWDSLERDVA
jgi:CheY-like chemotaxis protein